MEIPDFDFLSLKGFLLALGSFMVQHPLLSVFFAFCFFVFIMWISHMIDIVEGNGRNAMLIFFFLLFLTFAIIIFLLALQEGTIAIPSWSLN